MTPEAEAIVRAFFGAGVVEATFKVDGETWHFWRDEGRFFQLHLEGTCPSVYELPV